MPNTREKLLELFKQGFYKYFEPNINGAFFDVIVDHLIANGVTFATDNNVGDKWISVKDELPEDDSHVLAYLRIGEEGRIYPAYYAKRVWFDCIFNTPTTRTTTHWMPLPTPPKGE